MAEIELTIDGTREVLREVPTHRTLLEHLRRSGRVGTKEGCAEGDCGACTVAVVAADASGSPSYQAINSCLVPLVALAGHAVVTVEGVDGDGLHPVQAAMIAEGGSQCGYCTPGFVMSLFSSYYQPERPLGDDAVEGNLCRCTGYLPIRRAAASLGPAAADDPHRRHLAEDRAPPAAVAYQHAGQRFFRPATLAQALQLLADHPDARLVAGATDLGLEITKFRHRFPILVSLEALPELKVLEDGPEATLIGAGLPLSHLEQRLAGTFPALDEMLRWFAARQIRNRATLGGNLGTASPIGDLPPVLLALEAEIEVAGPEGDHTVAIADFFGGYRQTALRPGEIIRAVRVPKALATGAARRISFAYKVGKRGTDDISIVAAAYALDLASDGTVVRARLGYGGVAAIPLRARDVEAWLEGQRWSQPLAAEAAQRLRQAFTPIDDLRGSADYRRRLAGNLFLKFFAEHPPTTPTTGEVAA